jgi:hypothetical protein
MNEAYKDWCKKVGLSEEDGMIGYKLAKTYAALGNGDRNTGVKQFDVKMPPMPYDVSGNAGGWFGFMAGFAAGVEWVDSQLGENYE